MATWSSLMVNADITSCRPSRLPNRPLAAFSLSNPHTQPKLVQFFPSRPSNPFFIARFGYIIFCLAWSKLLACQSFFTRSLISYMLTAAALSFLTPLAAQSTLHTALGALSLLAIEVGLCATIYVNHLFIAIMANKSGPPFLRFSKFSDLHIHCRDHTWYAHQIVVLPHSDRLEKACDAASVSTIK